MKLQDIPRKVHFVGIGGIGMSGLAQYLAANGYRVTGSDRKGNDRTDALSRLGVKIHIGHDKNNVADAEIVVRTSAVYNDNPEVTEAAARHIPVILREQLLGAVFNSFQTRIAVCGTHGKTTVTAMLHEILSECGIAHTALIGGVYHGNNCYLGGGVIVAEACEYNRSFLNLNPTICVCVNAEYDHPDCYANKEEIREAFRTFMNNVQAGGTVVLPRELEYLDVASKRVFYDDVKAQNLRLTDGKAAFSALYPDGSLQAVRLAVPGRHNVTNALVALAVSRLLGIDGSSAAEALSRFDGVDRRWTESRGVCRIVRDYAHHPTEIACAVDTAVSVTGGRVICLFQPHTYTRTKAFLQEFADCFAKADKVAYLPVYSAREAPVAGADSQTLARMAVQRGVDAEYVANFDEAVAWVKRTVNTDDLLLILGAGDVAEIADRL